MTNACTCGHDRTAHQHMRSGSDCALCADGECNRFRGESPAKRWLTRVVGSVIRPDAEPVSRRDAA